MKKKEAVDYESVMREYDESFGRKKEEIPDVLKPPVNPDEGVDYLKLMREHEKQQIADDSEVIHAGNNSGGMHEAQDEPGIKRDGEGAAADQIDTSMLDMAVLFAVRKHAGTPRKGTSLPYIVHPMETAAIVAGMTDDQELIAAAVLHDTMEDTGTTWEELSEIFGPRVADLVAAESEDKQEDKPAESTWEQRKQATLNHLKNAGVEVRMLALADKLSNIRAIQRDLKDCKEKGISFWARFNQKDPAKHGWYYGSMVGIFQNDPKLKDTQACREYAERVEEVFGKKS